MNHNLTQRDYDFLAIVRNLTDEGWPARIKDIAKKLNVKPPTAVEYIDRLVKCQALEKGPSGYRLTEKGYKLTDDMERVHRLFETLLYKTGLPLIKAHKISSFIDRQIDSKEVEEICSFLDHPKQCPHGEPIPPGDDHDSSEEEVDQ